jgi:hypothetical protein
MGRRQHDITINYMDCLSLSVGTPVGMGEYDGVHQGREVAEEEWPFLPLAWVKEGSMPSDCGNC